MRNRSPGSSASRNKTGIKRSRKASSGGPVCGYVFDEHRCNKRGAHYCRPRAEKARAFFHEALVHTKGRFARHSFILAYWQWHHIIAPAFGMVRWSKELGRYIRQFRTVWIEIARKNGKSELLAAVALYMLIADDEESAEIYGCAKDVAQARKVWDVAERMVKLSPALNKLLKSGKIKINVQEKKIIYVPTGSYYQVITGDATGELGHNAHCVIFDEVLAQPGPNLWAAMASSMDAREQPMMWAASTAGDPNTFAADEHDYCVKVARDPRLDPSRLVFIRSVPREASIWIERNWRKANPALGDFKSLEGMRAQAKEARNDPRKESKFRQFHGNQWGNVTELWIPTDRYDASAGMVVEEQLHGRLCYGALHLAAATDITALILDVSDDEGGHDIVRRFWVPRARMEDLNRRTDGKAELWEREGWLRVTEGDMIDYDEIRRQVGRDGEAFAIETLAYHRLGMAQLANELDEEGFPVTPVSTTMASLAGATKEFERLIYEGLYHHGGDPVFAWMVTNIGIKKDSDQNIRIDPKLSKDSVVGPVAAVMALSVALKDELVEPTVVVGGRNPQ